MTITRKSSENLAWGIGVGMLLGISLGMILNNLDLWLSLGMLFGVALGAVYDHRSE